MKRPAPGSSRRRPSTPGARSRTGILPVSPCGSAKRIRPVSICTRRCSAIPEMWPPSALWPTSTLTAAKIRSLRNRWPARAWPASRISEWLAGAFPRPRSAGPSVGRPRSLAEGRGIVEKPDWKRGGGLFAEGVLLFSPATAVTLLRSPPPFPRTSPHGPRP